MADKEKMTDKEKIILLEEMLELEENSLNEETMLSDLDEWDSMAILMLINLADVKFKKKLAMTQIREFKTIGDILNFFD
jgi:acyl carrier protein